jgi:hypothetical protein
MIYGELVRLNIATTGVGRWVEINYHGAFCQDFLQREGEGFSCERSLEFEWESRIAFFQCGMDWQRNCAKKYSSGQKGYQ